MLSVLLSGAPLRTALAIGSQEPSAIGAVALSIQPAQLHNYRDTTAGDAEFVNDSFWYVKSSLQLTTLRDRIWAAMDANRDSLVVVDASGNDFEAEGITFDKHQFMKTEWYK